MLKCVFGDAITTRCLFDCLNRRSVSSQYSWVLLAVFTLINAMTCRIFGERCGTFSLLGS